MNNIFSMLKSLLLLLIPFSLSAQLTDDGLARAKEHAANVTIIRDHWGIRHILEKKDYEQSPQWLHKLLDAYADGINYFLHTHPNVKPALLTHFEPWYQMLWTDGSIGAITTAGLNATDLQSFYGKMAGRQLSSVPKKPELYTGSNGFAIASALTKEKAPILYINPHVTFYF